ncbi:MAG: hypothetical protein PHV34_09895 [Verrucomicrobiae bacterium]|nr:hypothetical protein [Verrucomicrobiae bacterium]
MNWNPRKFILLVIWLMEISCMGIARGADLTISVSGATVTPDDPNKYIIGIPLTGNVTITITGGGSAPSLTDNDKCKCDQKSQDPVTDGDPIYTFFKDVGDQNPANGPTINWNVDASTAPGQYKFKLTSVEQKYKACPSGWTGGVSSKSNTSASREVTIIVPQLDLEGPDSILYVAEVGTSAPADFQAQYSATSSPDGGTFK